MLALRGLQLGPSSLVRIHKRCLQYHILNQRTLITPIQPLKQVSGTIMKFVYFMYINNNKYSQYVISSIIFGITRLPLDSCLLYLYRHQKVIYLLQCTYIVIKSSFVIKSSLFCLSYSDVIFKFSCTITLLHYYTSNQPDLHEILYISDLLN